MRVTSASRPPASFLAAALVFGLTLCDSRGETPAPKRSLGQTVFVPVYSHIYTGDRETQFLLAVTLSIRNSDPQHPIEVLSVDYFDSEGKLVRKYLEAPLTLQPLAAVRYVVKESDRAGGSGASFLLKWKAAQPSSPPVAESIMIGTRNQQGISFVSRGQVIPDTDGSE